MSQSVHPVDEKLPAPRLAALGLQHVLVMYAGAVAVPLIIGRALKLPPEQVAVLISADLFACGIATLIQSLGVAGIGIRLPVMMGVTFASVAPMLVMAGNASIGILGIFGAVIVAGLFGLLVAPFVSRLLPYFPPVVTGTIILVIGISLMRIGIGWAAGGLPVINGQPNPAYGALDGLGIALFVMLKTPALELAVVRGLRQASGQDPRLAAALDLRWLGFSYIAFRLLHTLRGVGYVLREPR